MTLSSLHQSPWMSSASLATTTAAGGNGDGGDTTGRGRATMTARTKPISIGDTRQRWRQTEYMIEFFASVANQQLGFFFGGCAYTARSFLLLLLIVLVFIRIPVPQLVLVRSSTPWRWYGMRGQCLAVNLFTELILMKGIAVVRARGGDLSK